MGIIAAYALTSNSTYHCIKVKSPGQMVFGKDMILPIMHIEDWGYIRQRKQEETEK